MDGGGDDGGEVEKKEGVIRAEVNGYAYGFG